jgi:hypothetical protein
VEITCPRCTARHDIDLPGGARARSARPLRFRCSHCGHSFTVDPAVAAAVAGAGAQRAPERNLPPAAAEAPPSSRHGAPVAPALPTGARSPGGSASQPVTEAITRVQVQGHPFDIPDLATLQRWILEERVRPDDLCARDGGPWVPLHTRAELALFFSAAARLSESPAAIERLVAPPIVPPLPSSDPATVLLAGAPHALDDAERATTVADPPTAAPGDPEDTRAQSTLLAPFLPEPREAPTVVSAPDLSRDVPALPMGATSGSANEPAATSPFGGPPSRPLGDFGPSPGVAGTLAPVPDADNAFDFPAQPDHDVFTDAAPRAPARAARGLVTGVVVVLAVIGVFAGVRSFGSGSHARPEAEPAAAARTAEPPAAKPPLEAEPATPTDPPAAAAASDAPAVPAEPPAAAVPAPAPEAPANPAPSAAAPPTAAPAAKAPAREKVAPSTAAGTKSTRPASSGVPQRMLSEGWKAVEAGDFEAAHDRFSLALQGKASAGALYGRGYANEKLGRKGEAGSDYCRALGLEADVDLTREIQSGLRRIGHAC